MSAPVIFVSPRSMFPTSLIAGQSVWVGCGADMIWCVRLSWFTNVTRAPMGTRTSCGFAPAAVMVTVNVAGAAGAGAGAGALGEPEPPPDPPHAASTSTTIGAAARGEN